MRSIVFPTLGVRCRALLVVAAMAMCATMTGKAGATPILCTLPTGTQVHFHLTAPISSNESTSGQTFGFVLLQPIASDACTIPADGSKGSGTIVLAGKAGIHGHEGDLTLTLDTIATPDGRLLTFDDQVLEINGGNHKVEAGALNLVPDVGIVANFIHGKDVKVDPSTPVETTLLRPAIVRNAPLPSSAPSP
jgi:hypothetical protein